VPEDVTKQFNIADLVVPNKGVADVSQSGDGTEQGRSSKQGNLRAVGASLDVLESS